MKKLLLSFAVIAVVTGCVAVRLKPGASVEVTTTNAPPVINNVVTNPITIPNTFAIKLYAESESNLVRAIENAGSRVKKTDVVVTNANPINFNPIITNVVNALTNPMVVSLNTSVENALITLATKPWWQAAWIWVIAGGAISGLLGYLFSFLMHNHQKSASAKTETKFLDGLYKAIQTEAETVDAVYAKGLGADVAAMRSDESKKYFTTQAMLTVDWFPVFTGNTQHIGRLQETSLNSILTFQACVRDLAETFRINNRYLETLKSCEARIVAKRDDIISIEERRITIEALEKYRGIILRLDCQYAKAYKSLTGKDADPLRC